MDPKQHAGVGRAQAGPFRVDQIPVFRPGGEADLGVLDMGVFLERSGDVAGVILPGRMIELKADPRFQRGDGGDRRPPAARLQREASGWDWHRGAARYVQSRRASCGNRTSDGRRRRVG